MASVLERIRRANRPPLSSLPVEQARQFYNAGAEVLDLPRAPLARVEDFLLPLGAGHAVAARLYAVDHGHLPVLLFFHGGGFVVGSLETHDSLCRQLARHSGSAVLALDYRLAPEHPFPCAVEDAWAAMAWLFRHASALGLDAGRVTVAGDSAGATLAAVCALHARDQGWPLRGQVLITPHTAADGGMPSRQRFGEGFLLDERTLSWFFDKVLPSSQRTDWRFAPLEAVDLDGVAPACLVLAECDPLVDEGLAYADRLRWANVPVDLELVRGVTHEFVKMGRLLPEAVAAQMHVAQAVRQWCA